MKKANKLHNNCRTNIHLVKLSSLIGLNNKSMRLTSVQFVPCTGAFDTFTLVTVESPPSDTSGLTSSNLMMPSFWYKYTNNRPRIPVSFQSYSNVLGYKISFSALYLDTSINGQIGGSTMYQTNLGNRCRGHGMKWNSWGTDIKKLSICGMKKRSIVLEKWPKIPTTANVIPAK